MDEAAPQAAGWWCLAPPGELALAQAEQDAARALLERRWSLIRAHRDRGLKIWYPWETEEGGWLATWVGEPEPGEHREAVEGDLYDWLEASLDGLDKWLDAHPGAEVHMDGDRWEDSVPLSGGARLRTPQVRLGELRAAMEVIAERAAACKRVEADFPGWLAGVAPGGEWAAFREDGTAEVKADGEPGLREAIAASEASLGGTS